MIQLQTSSGEFEKGYYTFESGFYWKVFRYVKNPDQELINKINNCGLMLYLFLEQPENTLLVKR